MRSRKRRIGPFGTSLRVIVGLGLLYLTGGANGLSWSPEPYDAVLGVVVIPAITVLVGLWARRRGRGPLRFTGPVGIALNCAVIVALLSNRYTGDATTFFYATTLLVAAWRGLPGCEVTVVSNWIVRRDDQVGCPIFSPIDALEARHRTPRGAPVAVHD